MVKNKILKEINFFPPKTAQDLTFSAFSKVEKLTSKFLKTLERIKKRNKIFQCSKLLLFFQKKKG